MYVVEITAKRQNAQWEKPGWLANMRSQLNAYWIFGCIFPRYKYMKNVYLCIYDHLFIETLNLHFEHERATMRVGSHTTQQSRLRSPIRKPRSVQQAPNRIAGDSGDLKVTQWTFVMVSALAGERKLWYSVFRIRFIELLIELPHTSNIWRIHKNTYFR